MALQNSIFDEINNAQSQDDLDRLWGFIQGGEQNELNDRARDLIRKRGAEIASIKSGQAANESIAQQAKDFGSNQAKYSDQFYAPRADAARKDLAAQIAGVNKGYSSRGILYGGAAQGARSQAQGNYAANLTRSRLQSNMDAENLKNQYTQSAVSGGLAQQAIDMGQSNQDLQQALYERQRKNNQTGAIFGTAGSLLGFGAGAAMNSGGQNKQSSRRAVDETV